MTVSLLSDVSLAGCYVHWRVCVPSLLEVVCIGGI
jgi:hypothetical protein